MRMNDFENRHITPLCRRIMFQVMRQNVLIPSWMPGDLVNDRLSIMSSAIACPCRQQMHMLGSLRNMRHFNNDNVVRFQPLTSNGEGAKDLVEI